jgi:PAS domain S-box-containing protein
MRVLVVDDDDAMRQVVRRSLHRAELDVIEAADGAAALALQREAEPTVAVVDIDLPDTTGLELMAELRRCDPDLPVILLTGAASEEDRVRGLVSGADDFVVKPFSGPELAARVFAVSRRRRVTPTPASDPTGIRIDASAREVWVGGEPIDLTRREFDLLRHLAQHPGRVFTRPELLEAVWASSADWQSEATVTEHIRRLRTKLELDPRRPSTIVTVRGTGYRYDPGPAAGMGQDEREASGADLAEDPVAVIQGGKVVRVNEAAVRLVGAAHADQVEGRPFLDFIAPRSIGASKARSEEIRLGRRWPRPEVLTIRRIDGQELHAEVASSPVLWQGRQASQITLWDLAGDTSKLRELATGVRSDVAEAVIVCDARMRVQSFNPAAELLYGWREGELVGRNLTEAIPWLRDDLTAERVRDAFQRHGRWHGDLVQRRRDGSTVTVRSSVTLLRDRSGTPVGITCVNRPAGGSPPPRPPHAVDPALADEIRRGIERHEFVLHYQPVVELDTGRWVGVEALVRWAHPERGLLLPAEFIHAAERSGAIVDLGQLVFDEATRQWRRWREEGADLHVAVNLSARQLVDPNLPARMGAALEAADVPAGCLRFEVTETALVEDLAEATAALRRLVDLGARIAIDDFGTGWASLTYLREFPVHALKVDRTFVAGLGANVPDSAIVSSIVSLGSELGLDVIAEGIETPLQLERLRALGCEQGQGFLLARPSPAETISAHLAGR